MSPQSKQAKQLVRDTEMQNRVTITVVFNINQPESSQYVADIEAEQPLKYTAQHVVIFKTKPPVGLLIC